MEKIDELVRRARKGDETAITRLVGIYKGFVYTIAYRMVNDPDRAEDITQETFIRAFIKIDSLKDPGRFKTWLGKITRNLIYDHLRQERKEWIEVVVTNPGDGMASIRRRVIIQKALSRLREQDRMLLVLTYFKGLSLREVGKIMEIPEADIRVYIHRARRRLRKELKGYEEELLSV
ncbi:MAG TPA: sigma-70 family RNA polymerase sigma factor [bacterium (Candidatus Stahlbacteria)]|nr:sigma-70 family RNA polymerase sigma factor [Candidatus Stahlbacteria bacterium]